MEMTVQAELRGTDSVTLYTRGSPGRCDACDVSTGATLFRRLYALLAVCLQASFADATPSKHPCHLQLPRGRRV